MTGCDTVSALFNIGKRKIIDILSDPMENWDMLHIFSCKTSTQSNEAKVRWAPPSEVVWLKVYNRWPRQTTTHKLHETSQSNIIDISRVSTSFSPTHISISKVSLPKGLLNNSTMAWQWWYLSNRLGVGTCRWKTPSNPYRSSSGTRPCLENSKLLLLGWMWEKM